MQLKDFSILKKGATMVKYTQRYFTGDVSKRLREIKLVGIERETVKQMVSKKDKTGKDIEFECHNCEQSFKVVNTITYDGHTEILCHDCFEDLSTDRLNDILEKEEKKS